MNLVNLTTNSEDGLCSGDPITVTCSVIGSSLRWTVTDTSLEIIGSDTVTLNANSDSVGTLSSIRTSTIPLEINQTGTIQNLTHPSSSSIESQMQFHLLTGEFVEVSCGTAHDVRVVYISPIGMFMRYNLRVIIIVLPCPTDNQTAPTGAHVMHNITSDEGCSHVIGWNMTDKTGLREYLLISVINDSVVERPIHVHREENTTIYNQRLIDKVTLVIQAISRCNVANGTSEPLSLRKLHLHVST